MCGLDNERLGETKTPKNMLRFEGEGGGEGDGVMLVNDDTVRATEPFELNRCGKCGLAELSVQ